MTHILVAVAWLLLAVAGGRTLASLTRTKRRLLLIAPIIFLVCFSAVVTPTTSPQYGFRTYHQPGMTSYIGLPDSEKRYDRSRLGKRSYCRMGNYRFSNLMSTWCSLDIGPVCFLLIASRRASRITAHSFSRDAESNTVSFFRWWNVRISSQGQACNGLISDLTNQQRSRIVDVLYDNSCDVVMGG